MKYFVDYVLGWHSPANIAAEKGSIVHKALEMIARVKFAKQKHQLEIEDEIGKFKIADLTQEIILNLAYHNSVEKTKQWYDWNDSHFEDCKKWLNIALKYNNGMFNPMKQEIIIPEKYFDITIEEDWAKYNYKLPNGKQLEGQLAIKGTMDLIAKVDDNTYEMIDYKTGKRKDWNTGEEKTYEKLCTDAQLRMYYYAASKSFPNIKQIIVTIFYINDGGPISMCFTKDDLEKTEEMLKKRFNAIRNTHKPKKIYPNWKCSKLCYFGKHDMNHNKITADEYKEKSICAKIGNELLTLGMERVMMKHNRDETFKAYSEGGGRSGVK